MDDRGGCVTRSDLERYRAEWSDPVAVDYAGTRLFTREGLSAVLATAAGAAAVSRASERDRALRWAKALADPPGTGHDEHQRGRRGRERLRSDHEPRAGSGDFLPGSTCT